MVLGEYLDVSQVLGSALYHWIAFTYYGFSLLHPTQVAVMELGLALYPQLNDLELVVVQRGVHALLC